MGEALTMTGPPTLSLNLQGTNAFSWQDTNV
jgi:hypothetical protein